MSNEIRMTSENRALIYSPLVMPFAFALFAFVADIPGFNMDKGIGNYLASMLTVIVFGIPVVYIFEFFIGYRFYRLFLKKGKINLFTLMLGGMLIADIPMFFILIFSAFSSYSHNISTAFLLFSFVGSMIGLTFWVCLNLDEIRRRFSR